jgi:hypothetical protein
VQGGRRAWGGAGCGKIYLRHAWKPANSDDPDGLEVKGVSSPRCPQGGVSFPLLLDLVVDGIFARLNRECL